MQDGSCIRGTYLKSTPQRFVAVLSLVVLQYYSIHYNRLVAVLSLYVLQYYIRTVFYYL